jgi:hypothetical protein
MRLMYAVSFVSTVVLFAMMLAPSHPVQAKADYQGSLEIQAQVCPPGALRLSAECVQERGPLGVMIAIDQSRPKAMDSTGRVSFDDIVAGQHLVTIKNGPYAERFRKVRAICSSPIAGIYPGPAIIDTSYEPRFQVQLVPRSHAVCQIYFIP